MSDMQRIIDERDWLRAEVQRVRGLIVYTLDGPDDPSTWRSLLSDALIGVTGASDCDELRRAAEVTP